MTKIKVYDAIMGSGKTHNAIERMKSYVKEEKKFIYITPFLSEIKRIQGELPEDLVKVPLSPKDGRGITFEVDDGSYNVGGNIDLNAEVKFKPLNKRAQFLRFISREENVIATHSLFSSLRKEDFELFKDYILILDEVINPLEIRAVGERDIQIMKEQSLIIIDSQTQEVRFVNDDYNDPAFSWVKSFCNSSSVYYQDSSFFVWIFPEEIFREFKEIQVLTYLFRGSLLCAYFDMINLDYEIITNDESHDLLEIKKLLNIYNGVANEKSRFLNTFSKTWCLGITKRRANKFSNKASNIFKRNFKTTSKFNAFTTFKDARSKFSGNSYAKGFIPVNARATNDFGHKKSMAYLANRFFNPQQRNFFIERGIKLDEDLWALGELVQWVWRGCIRNKQPMNLYVPSHRMRTLLYNWLDGYYAIKPKYDIKLKCA